MKLDLSKFKKAESDDKCTVLMHPSGHKIKIAHKGLSSDAMKNLDSIPVAKAMGGPMSQQHERGAKASKPSKSSNTMPGSPTEAKNGFTEPDDMGTNIPKAQLQSELSQNEYPDVVIQALNKKAPPFGPLDSEPKQHYPPCINPSCKSYGRSHPNCRCYGGGGGSVGEQGHFAKGGEVSKEYYCDNNRPHFKKCELYADGGPVSQPPPQNPPQQPVTNQDQTNVAQESMRKAFHFAKGTPPGGVPEMTDAEKLDQAAQEASAGSAPIPQSQPAPVDPNSPDNMVSNFNQDAQKMAPGSFSPDAPQPQQDPQSINPNPEIASQPDEAPDRTPSSQPSGDAPQIPAPQTPVQVAQNTKATLTDEAQKVQQDLDNGHIKPETYKDLFEKKDTLGKIGTIFGLLVGGMGSGLTHQPNALLGMMSKEISNDLDAQTKSAANRQNFMSIAQKGLMNKAAVTGQNIANQTNQRALAWSAQARTALHAQVQNAMNLPEGSTQRAQAMQALTILGQGIDKKESDIFSQAGLAQAMSESMGGNGGGNGSNTKLMKSGMMGPAFKEVGEDTEQKTIPGIPGQATRPIEGKDRDQIQAMNVLSNKASDLMGFAKQHTGTLSPAQRAIGQQKADEMVNFYNQSLASGALTQGRLGWLDEQIKKNPTGLFTQLMGNNARLSEIKNSNDMRKNLLLKSYGYNVPSGGSGGSSGGMTSKSGRPMIQKNGKWVYQ